MEITNLQDRHSVPLILASSSPRRRLLLAQAGYTFEVDPSDCAEPEAAPGVLVADYVADLAWRKASHCLYRADQGFWLGFVDRSVCRCRVLSDEERTTYLDSGLWQGKAGAYGVQDDDPFVAVTAGSWSSVVGLPVERLAAIFRQFPNLTADPG